MIRLRHEKGFTILEILLAVVILTVGLLGLLAVFPVAMRAGKDAVENTNAVIISQSVEQAIREGLAQHKGQSQDGRWTYFVCNHDGVTDPLPTKIEQARPDADYYILLPSSDPDRKSAIKRTEFWERGKTFVFPETDGLSWIAVDGGVEREVFDESSSSSPNGRGNPLQADDDSDDDDSDDDNGDNDGDEEGDDDRDDGKNGEGTARKYIGIGMSFAEAEDSGLQYKLCKLYKE